MVTNLLGAFAGKNMSVWDEALNAVFNMVWNCINRNKPEYISDLVYNFGIFFHLVDKVLLKNEPCTIVARGLAIVKEILSSYTGNYKDNELSFEFQNQ